jgi:hypothetical protein
MIPSSNYGTGVAVECSSLIACQQRIKDDFHEMKLMGFNTIRIGTNINKTVFNSPMCPPIGPGPHNYKDKFVLHYQEFPEPVPAPSCNGVSSYPGNGESQRFLPITPPYDFTTNPSLQPLVAPMMDVFGYAETEGLKIILITAGGKFLLNNEIYPQYSNNTSISMYENHMLDYSALLQGIAKVFKNNVTLLAYDIWNEPAWHDDVQVLNTKSQVCSYVSHWYNSIKIEDQNHLITMGLSTYHDVTEWDPSVMKLDFLSEHIYPTTPEFEYNYSNSTHDQVKAKNRYHAELLWLKRNLKIPWLIGETGFSASINSSPAHQVYLNGNEDEQADFAQFSLNEVRNAGASGNSWWQFQEVFWWDVLAGSAYIENWWGFIRRGNPDNGSYASYRKPLTSHFQNFLVGSVGNFDSNRNAAYYDPFSFRVMNSGLLNAMTGKVTNTLGQPIADAVIKGTNWTYTLNADNPDLFDDEPQGHLIYTFSDDNGDYWLVPFNNLAPNDASKWRIINYECSALSCNRFPSPWQQFTTNPYVGWNNFTLTQEQVNITNVYNEYVSPGQIENYNGGSTLNVQNMNISTAAIVELTASNEIHISPNLEAAAGSNVHIYIKTVHQNCVDVSNIRASNPEGIKKFEVDNKNILKSEIEIQFKKTGRQQLDAELQPNPSNGIVSLLIKENSSTLPVKISVYNTLGQFIKSYETNETQILLDGINWQKGVYIINIRCENNNITKKVVIN